MKQKKLSRESFFESGEPYRLMVEHANEGIFVAQNGFIRYSNPKVLAMTGYTMEELLTNPFMDKIHPADRDMVGERHWRRVRGEDVTNIYPYRIIDKKGNTIWLETNVVMIHWEGKPATLNFANDITDRKMTEDALRASEERYRTLFHTVPVSVFCYDRSLAILDCNEPFARLSKTSRERLVGADMTRVRDQRVIPCLMAVLEGREGKYDGHYRSTLTEDELWVVLRTAPLRDGNGVIVGGTGMIQDMTDNNKAQEELTLKSQYLEQANTTLKVFLRHREEEKQKLQSDVVANVRELVLPYVDKLKNSRSNSEKVVCTEIIENNLHRIVSPFLRNVSHYQLNLTPREIEIANLIRDGKSSKDIGRLLNISVRSVEFYRTKIRHKLGLTSSRTNLRSQLLAHT